MAIGDDVNRSVSLGREGEADGGYGRKKKKKKGNLDTNKKDIIFHIKN